MSGTIDFVVVSATPTSANVTDEGRDVTETVILRASGSALADQEGQVYPASGEITVGVPEGSYVAGQKFIATLEESDEPVDPGTAPGAPSASTVGEQLANHEERLDALDGGGVGDESAPAENGGSEPAPQPEPQPEPEPVPAGEESPPQ